MRTSTVLMLAILVRAALGLFFNSCGANRTLLPAGLPSSPLQLLAAIKLDGCKSVVSTKVDYVLQGVRDSQGRGRHGEGGREAGPGLRHRRVRGAACRRQPGRHPDLHSAGAPLQQRAGSLVLCSGNVQRALRKG